MDDRRKMYALKRRRERYHADPEYREKCRERAMEYHRKKMLESPHTASQTLFRGADGVMYSTLGRVAALVNRSPWTLRHYIRTGVIPPATFRDERNTVGNARRLYSPNQVDAFVRIFAMFDARQLRSMDEVGAMLRKEFGDGKRKVVTAS